MANVLLKAGLQATFCFIISEACLEVSDVWGFFFFQMLNKTNSCISNLVQKGTPFLKWN